VHSLPSRCKTKHDADGAKTERGVVAGMPRGYGCFQAGQPPALRVLGRARKPQRPHAKPTHRTPRTGVAAAAASLAAGALHAGDLGLLELLRRWLARHLSRVYVVKSEAAGCGA